MRRGVRTGFLLATVGAMSIGGTVMAYAGWTVPSPAGKATVRAATVPGGVTPSAAVQGGNAVVSWSAQEIAPGLRMTGYVVTAHSVDATPLPDIARTVVAAGSSTESAVFPGSELAGGKWKWAITPAFGSWTGLEGRLSNPKLGFPAAHPATVLAGAAPSTGSAVTPVPGEAVVLTPTAPTPAATTRPATLPPTESTPAPPATVEPSTSPTATPSTSASASASATPETRMD